MILCPRCNCLTKSIEPVSIFKNNFFRFEVKALCCKCNSTKEKYLSPTEMRRLPEEFKKIPLKQAFLKYVHIDNKAVELFPSLDGIINT